MKILVIISEIIWPLSIILICITVLVFLVVWLILSKKISDWFSKHEVGCKWFWIKDKKIEEEKESEPNVNIIKEEQKTKEEITKEKVSDPDEELWAILMSDDFTLYEYKKKMKEILEKIPNKEEKCKKEIILLGNLKLFKKISIINDTDRLAEENPNNIEALIFRSEVYRDANLSDPAITIVDKILTENHDENIYFKSIIIKSDCYLQKQKFQDAIDFLLSNVNSKIKDNKNIGKLYEKVGEIYKKMEENTGTDYFNQQIINWKKALKYLPANESLLFSIAYDYSIKGNDKLSLYYYLKLLKINPRHASALNNIGICFGKLDILTKKIEYFLLTVKEEDTFVIGNIAIELARIGFLEEAKSYINKAREKTKKYPKLLDKRVLEAEKYILELEVSEKSKYENLLKEVEKLGLEDEENISKD
ncbi:MAG: hypothetical protein Q7K21_06700 [Elusimicrobiota bacterium]|nr:hypothetical protein [Elusimicrobiota bacterium]